jgi:4,5-DOPA dioxygenase extradiol
LPKPKAVCVVSAHWVTGGCRPKTIHDFFGFPRPLYEVQYSAPGAVTEAKRLAMEHQLLTDHHWGLDHGAWSVLRHLYPDADVPVFQVSLDQARLFQDHVALGRQLRHLRERGVLILGSGNLVHNLRKINWEMLHGAYPWAEEFDDKVKKAIAVHDVESLSAPDRWGSSLLAEAHPTLEHYVPILYCLGSTDERDRVTYPYEGMEFGMISMRMALFEPANA